jgi:heme-degrading monooxygenase HmoA
MIARVWAGAVKRDDGDAYADYMSATGIPGYRNTPGNVGAFMLRREASGLCEFVMLSLWESMSSIEAFTGEQPDKAVFYPEDDRFLVQRDLTVRHYEVDPRSSWLRDPLR